MINIRPVSDLRNRFTEIERIVNTGEPVYLTKNGYGSMVVISLQEYSRLTEDVEIKLDEADKVAEIDPMRFSHDEVFGSIREKINNAKTV